MFFRDSLTTLVAPMFLVALLTACGPHERYPDPKSGLHYDT